MTTKRMTVEEAETLQSQKDNAYSERNKCVVGLALLARDLGYKVGLARHPESDTEWEDDWRNIVVIELPTGQLTWHFHDSEMHMLYSFTRLEGHAWDGHTTDEKYRRLLDYTPRQTRGVNEAAGDAYFQAIGNDGFDAAMPPIRAIIQSQRDSAIYDIEAKLREKRLPKPLKSKHMDVVLWADVLQAIKTQKETS